MDTEKKAKKVKKVKNTHTRGSVPPELEDVTAYCHERSNSIDPQAFIDYYATRGWKLNSSTPMKDWMAAVRTWENRRKADDAQSDKQDIGRIRVADYSHIKSYEPPADDEAGGAPGPDVPF